ncbi:hypothetical protein NEUTE2DRAFT_130547 [Neurospora tetrasperma FGSC 2509]|nr:hypothetical protein NEUTE2DRAFT_130547 [Neurospora tetrasperma FGSC 2509]
MYEDGPLALRILYTGGMCQGMCAFVAFRYGRHTFTNVLTVNAHALSIKLGYTATLQGARKLSFHFVSADRPFRCSPWLPIRGLVAPPSSHALADVTDGGSREMRATAMTDAAPGTQTLGHPSPIPDFFMKLGPTTPQQALTCRFFFSPFPFPASLPSSSALTATVPERQGSRRNKNRVAAKQGGDGDGGANNIKQGKIYGKRKRRSISTHRQCTDSSMRPSTVIRPKHCCSRSAVPTPVSSH